MKRFLLEVSTNWCGEDNTYSAYAETEQELVDILSEKAYENFSDFGGFDMILEELFPEVEDNEYTEEMIHEAGEVEGEYYFGHIVEWDEERDDEEWGDYDLVYDGRTKQINLESTEKL